MSVKILFKSKSSGNKSSKTKLHYPANKALAGEMNSEGHMFGFLDFHGVCFPSADVQSSRDHWVRSMVFFSGIASSMSILMASAPPSSFLILQLVGTM